MLSIKKIIILIIVFAIGFFGTKFVLKQMHQEDKVDMEIKTKTLESMPVPDQSWTTLFDGKSFDGWHGYLKDSVPAEWTIKDGAMVFTPTPNREHGANDIASDQEFTNFILSLKWKISEGGNSGIFWGVQENEKFAVPYLTGPEIQILDDDKHPDGKKETHRAGSLYDMIAPRQKTVKPVGEWNTCVIKIDHKSNTGQVWLNKVLIVEFPVHGEEWENLVHQSKFKNWEHFGVNQTGKIALQDHGNQVSFKDIKIKEL